MEKERLKERIWHELRFCKFFKTAGIVQTAVQATKLKGQIPDGTEKGKVCNIPFHEYFVLPRALGHRFLYRKTWNGNLQTLLCRL